jgi:hypothetical protein
LVNKVSIKKIIIFLIKRKFAINWRISLFSNIGLDKSDDATIARLSMVISTVIFAFTSVIK